MLLILCRFDRNDRNILYRNAIWYENTSRFTSDQISAYFGSFWPISIDTRFWRNNKNNKNNSYLLLLGFVLFFLLFFFFFLISVSSSSSSFLSSSSSSFLSSSSASSSSLGFGLLPNYLFFFICVSLAVLHLCLDLRAFRL